MKTRIEVITCDSYENILLGCGYEKVGRLYVKDAILYKIAWLHLNNWGQLVYIDLIKVTNN